MKIETWHADSLAGPMGEMKKAFEAKNAGLTVNLTSGRSKELAELDPQKLTDAKAGNNYLADRRPELYGALSAR